MNEQQDLNNEYMTGREIVGGFLVMLLIFVCGYLMLLIGGA